MKLMYIAFIIYMEILAAEKNNESASLIKNISIFDNDLKIERTLYEKKKEAHYRKDALTRYIASLKIQKKISLKQISSEEKRKAQYEIFENLTRYYNIRSLLHDANQARIKKGLPPRPLTPLFPNKSTKISSIEEYDEYDESDMFISNNFTTLNI